MNDRELLELAAKAAGVEGEYESWVGQWFMEGIRQKNFKERCFRVWNPLRYDDQALRLAVKLHMDFTLSGKHAAVAQAGSHFAQEYCNGDPYEATRRAIVRAAAEIGKVMQ